MSKLNFKQELQWLGGLYVALVVIFLVTYRKESFVTILWSAFSFFWYFVLPGYFLMLYFHNFSFMERFIGGIAVGGGAVGILSYYLGLVGVHARLHWLLPIIFIALGLYINKTQISKSF